MFCSNCGAENVEHAKFCQKCGKPLMTGQRQEVGGNIGTNAGGINGVPPAAGVSGYQNGNAFPKKAVIGVCAVVALLAVVICVMANTGRTIRLDNYLVVEAEGYDGYGRADVKIDWDAVEAKYGLDLSFTDEAESEYQGLLSMMAPMDLVRDSVNVKLEENSGLSNGDVVAYTWDIDENLFQYVQCNVKCKDGTFQVSGLTEVGTFDAFAGLTLEFSGIAPNGNANLNYTGSEMNYYDFICDQTSGLSNGDTITVSIDDSNLERYAETLGKIPAELEKKFTVEGLESYLSRTDEIDDAALAAMQQQAVDVYHARAAQEWDESAALETLTYIGNYLLTSKSKDFWGTNNYLYLVYKAQIRNRFSSEGKSYNKLNEVYWYIGYTNVMIGGDGTVQVDLANYSTPNNRFKVDSGLADGWWEKTWSYYGYETLDGLYKDAVTANIDSYNHEDNVDESAAPQAAEEETAVKEEGGFILADSDTKLLTKEDLDGLSAEDCKIARNEIYARHGRKFKDEGLQAHFDACDWYTGIIEPDDFSEEMLSDIEIANKNLIVEYEKEKGFR